MLKKMSMLFVFCEQELFVTCELDVPLIMKGHRAQICTVSHKII